MPTSVTSPSTGATTALRLCAEGGSECGAALNRRSIHFSQKCRKMLTRSLVATPAGDGGWRTALPRRGTGIHRRTGRNARSRSEWRFPSRLPQSGAPSRRARRARCIRRNSKYRLGLIPSCSWQHTSQCPARHTDRLAEIRYVQRLVGICLEGPAKPPHDRFVAPQRRSVLAGLSHREALDQGVN